MFTLHIAKFQALYAFRNLVPGGLNGDFYNVKMMHTQTIKSLATKSQHNPSKGTPLFLLFKAQYSDFLF